MSEEIMAQHWNRNLKIGRKSFVVKKKSLKSAQKQIRDFWGEQKKKSLLYEELESRFWLHLLQKLVKVVASLNFFQ